MKSRLHWQRRPVSPALSPASALGPAIPEAGPATMARKKGRFLSPSPDFAPEAIKLVMQAGKPGHAFAVRRRSATNRRWDGHWGNDSGPFTAGRFAQFDGLFFTRPATLKWPSTVGRQRSFVSGGPRRRGLPCFSLAADGMPALFTRPHPLRNRPRFAQCILC